MTQNLEAIRRFILGGIAIFTIVSKRSGDRKTFRVRAAEDIDGSGKPHGYYVDLLTGPNNTEDYRYLAFMWVTERPLREKQNAPELHIKINKHLWGPEAFEVFKWFVNMLNGLTSISQGTFERQAEFHHAGMCSRCGRTLTEPESIELGIGPVCRGRG